MNISSREQLKQAVRNREPELEIAEPRLIRMVNRLMILRQVVNILFFVILGGAVLLWANPMRVPFFDSSGGRMVRQILLLFGILLLLADYLMPLARFYKISAR
ncbi:MAG: hypothetical protein ABIK11_01510, partial [candidate division WOR-3 bacterium]